MFAVDMGDDEPSGAVGSTIVRHEHPSSLDEPADAPVAAVRSPRAHSTEGHVTGNRGDQQTAGTLSVSVSFFALYISCNALARSVPAVAVVVAD